MSNILRNPGHHFGYIQLPLVIDTLYPEDKEQICWSPAALIEREIFKSEVDVMYRFGSNGELYYLGKAIELRTTREQRFLRIDTTDCGLFFQLQEYVKQNRPVSQHRPFLSSVHIDNFISDVHLVASTLHDEETGVPNDTVLNMVVITLVE